jgi:hypothetical protein
MPGQLVEDPRELESHQREHERVENERQDLPDGDSSQPRLHRGQLGRAPAEIGTGRHDGDDPGRIDRVRGDEGEVAGHEPDRHLDRRVVHAPPHGRHDEADDEADADAAHHRPEKVPRGTPEREGTRHRGDNGHSEEDQSRPVVHE